MGLRAAVLDRPVTAGAFKLTDWKKNESRRFERFDGYYKGQPYLDAVTDRLVGDGSRGRP
jgi:ABC-type transport system substrate-binding protein